MSGNISRSNNHPYMVQTWPAGEAATDPTTAVATSNTTSVSNHHLSRVTRPLNARKRSRASRRAPTTLLNTDTANFRAMVQRFTGGGNSGSDAITSAPFRSNESTVASSHQFLNTYNSNSSSFNDGFGSISTGGVAVRSDERYNSVQFSPPHSHPYFMMTTEDHGGSMTDHDGDDQHVGFRPRGSYNW